MTQVANTGLPLMVTIIGLLILVWALASSNNIGLVVAMCIAAAAGIWHLIAKQLVLAVYSIPCWPWHSGAQTANNSGGWSNRPTQLPLYASQTMLDALGRPSSPGQGEELEPLIHKEIGLHVGWNEVHPRHYAVSLARRSNGI